jgi:hypothetical protein
MYDLTTTIDDFICDLNDLVNEMVQACIRDDHMDERSFLEHLDKGDYTYEGEYGFIHFTADHQVFLEMEPRLSNPFNWHFRGDRINQKIVLDVELAFEKVLQ